MWRSCVVIFQCWSCRYKIERNETVLVPERQPERHCALFGVGGWFSSGRINGYRGVCGQQLYVRTVAAPRHGRRERKTQRVDGWFVRTLSCFIYTYTEEAESSKFLFKEIVIHKSKTCFLSNSRWYGSMIMMMMFFSTILQELHRSYYVLIFESKMEDKSKINGVIDAITFFEERIGGKFLLGECGNEHWRPQGGSHGVRPLLKFDGTLRAPTGALK